MKKHNNRRNDKAEPGKDMFWSGLGILLTLGVGVYARYGLGPELILYAAIMILILVSTSLLF